VDGLPLVFSGRGVNVLLAQKADVVGAFDQGVNGRRIVAEFLVVKLEGADILLAAVHCFDFAVALDLLNDIGHGNAHGYDEQSQQENDRDQNVSLFRGAGAVADWARLHF